MAQTKKRKLDLVDEAEEPSLKRLKQSGSKTCSSISSSDNPLASPVSALTWLLKGGADVQTFMTQYFGIKPLKITRNDPKYYAKQSVDLTLGKIESICSQYPLYHGIDIVSKHCVGESKEECPEWISLKQETNAELTMNDSSNEIAKILKDGLTMQYHHPQHHYYELMHLLHLLESYFKALAGCNVYLTPNNTQGLAPHWDDVDVWVLQIEGKKHWKCYSNGFDCQPIESSDDLNLAVDCPNAKLIMECDLMPGDLLYLPRGTIHCAQAIENDSDDSKCQHSNHLTISTHQQVSHGHFEKVLVDKAMSFLLNDDNTGFSAHHRQTADSRQLSGIGSSSKESTDSVLNQAVDMLLNSGDLKAAMKQVTKDTCDAIYIDFLRHRLPPTDQIDSTEGIVFGSEANRQKVEQRAKEATEAKQLVIGSSEEVKKDMEIAFANRDWVRFVDASKHSDLLEDENDAPMNGNIYVNEDDGEDEQGDSNGFSLIPKNGSKSASTQESLRLLDAGEDSKSNFESPAIPSRRQFFTKQLSKSSKKNLRRDETLRILSDSPAPTAAGKSAKEGKTGNKGKDGGGEEEDEEQDFDVGNASVTIVDQDFDSEALEDAYSYNDNYNYVSRFGKDNGDDDADNELLVFDCLKNDVQCHMTEFVGGNLFAPPIRLPLHLRPVLDTLFECYPRKITIAKLAKECQTKGQSSNGTGNDANEISFQDVQKLVEILYNSEIVTLS